MEVWRDELYHFGIMGMKWGVRRYQNPDGSLTAEGRSHYGSGERSSWRLTSKKKAKSSSKKFKKRKTSPKKEDISKLSDQELRNKLNRMQMERQYSQMTKRSQNAVEKTLKGIGKAAIVSVGTGMAVKYLTGGATKVEKGANTVGKVINSKLTDQYFRRLARRM